MRDLDIPVRDQPKPLELLALASRASGMPADKIAETLGWNVNSVYRALGRLEYHLTPYYRKSGSENAGYRSFEDWCRAVGFLVESHEGEEFLVSPRWERLSPKIRMTLLLVAHGWTIKRIAPYMGVSADTVKGNMIRMRGDLEAVSNPHAVARAFELKIFNFQDMRWTP